MFLVSRESMYSVSIPAGNTATRINRSWRFVHRRQNYLGRCAIFFGRQTRRVPVYRAEPRPGPGFISWGIDARTGRQDRNLLRPACFFLLRKTTRLRVVGLGSWVMCESRGQSTIKRKIRRVGVVFAPEFLLGGEPIVEPETMLMFASSENLVARFVIVK